MIPSITFFIAITLLTMTPGADTMIVIRNTIRGGMKDGWASSLGICLGLYVHATLSAVGISAILFYSQTAFYILKIIGAIYLIWLGFNNLKSFYSNDKLNDIKTLHVNFSFSRSITEGFLSNVLNPKTIVFYMAFLPQFISTTHSALIQSLILASFHFIIAIIWQGIIIYTINKANSFIMRPNIKKTLDFISGAVMIGLGIKLFFAHK
jgi:threonine/homoserine/homoserine lactone efflux protein